VATTAQGNQVGVDGAGDDETPVGSARYERRRAWIGNGRNGGRGPKKVGKPGGRSGAGPYALDLIGMCSRTQYYLVPRVLNIYLLYIYMVDGNRPPTAVVEEGDSGAFFRRDTSRASRPTDVE
jgi:hypothetical protein